MDGRDVLGLLGGWKGVPGVLRQRSLVEGVWNGRRGWLAVAAVVWGARGVQKALQRNEKVLLREVLRPGEQLLISQAIVKPTRRQGRKLAKQATRSGKGS